MTTRVESHEGVARPAEATTRHFPRRACGTGDHVSKQQVAHATPPCVRQLRKHYMKYRLKYELAERKEAQLMLRPDNPANDMSFHKEEVAPSPRCSPRNWLLSGEAGVEVNGYIASIRGRVLYNMLEAAPALREAQQRLAMALAILPRHGRGERGALVCTSQSGGNKEPQSELFVVHRVVHMLRVVHHLQRDEDEAELDRAILAQRHSGRSDSMDSDPFDEPERPGDPAVATTEPNPKR
eukprot:COSAG01_NODE_394_length_17660_cov_5.141954_5_plen_239_part_00